MADYLNEGQLARFEAKYLVVQSGCWEWQAALTGVGYGLFTLSKNVHESSHAVSYKHHVGPVPDGLELDHLCKNKICCNYKHLEPVTHAENTRRHFVGQTSCAHGHEYSAENTKYNRLGYRYCRTCTNISSARQRAKRKSLER